MRRFFARREWIRAKNARGPFVSGLVASRENSQISAERAFEIGAEAVAMDWFFAASRRTFFPPVSRNIRESLTRLCAGDTVTERDSATKPPSFQGYRYTFAALLQMWSLPFLGPLHRRLFFEAEGVGLHRNFRKFDPQLLWDRDVFVTRYSAGPWLAFKLSTSPRLGGAGLRRRGALIDFYGKNMGLVFRSMAPRLNERWEKSWQLFIYLFNYCNYLRRKLLFEVVNKKW